MGGLPLFEVESSAVEGDVDVLSTSAVGMAAQMDVAAELLRRGHKVAVPVVDDDGVDLVVDYRWAVQVKYSSLRSNQGLKVPLVCVGRMTRSHPTEPLKYRHIAEHVDVLVAVIAGVGTYVVPRAAVAGKRNMSMGPSMDQWRDAWSVFDAAR